MTENDFEYFRGSGKSTHGSSSGSRSGVGLDGARRRRSGGRGGGDGEGDRREEEAAEQQAILESIQDEAYAEANQALLRQEQAAPVALFVELEADIETKEAGAEQPKL